MLAGNLKNILASSLTDDTAAGIDLVIAVGHHSNTFRSLDRIFFMCSFLEMYLDFEGVLCQLLYSLLYCVAHSSVSEIPHVQVANTNGSRTE